MRYVVIETQGFNLLVTDNAANKLYYYATDKDVPVGSPMKLRASLDLTQVGQEEIKITPTTWRTFVRRTVSRKAGGGAPSCVTRASGRRGIPERNFHEYDPENSSRPCRFAGFDPFRGGDSPIRGCSGVQPVHGNARHCGGRL
jgi:hypothetical protein